MPLLFLLTLPRLYVAPWVSTGAVLHLSVCSVAEVSLGEKLGPRVSDLCSYAHFFFVCFGFVCFCVCVCTQRSSISRKPHLTFRLHIYPVPKYKQVHKLLKWTNRFETFTSLAVLCTPCWEKRKMGYILNWMQKGDVAEGACAHLDIGELLKDLNAGRTAESAFLVPANCWHHLLPLWSRCTSTYKPFESCYHLLIFKYIATCELHP